MGIFDIFKRKKEPDFPDIDMPSEYEPSFSPEITPLTEDETAGMTKLDESVLEEKSFRESRVTSATLENLCKKIDLESEDIDKQFKNIKNKVRELNLKSPEIIDLLNLYERTKQSLDSFVKEIDRFDFTGWGTDDNTAALYKFRACKSIANIKKEVKEIEKLSKQAGLTPSKVQQILTTPAEKLVEELSS